MFNEPESRFSKIKLGFEGDGCTKLVATCIDVFALNHRRETQLDSAAKILGVSKSYLAVVVHFGLATKQSTSDDQARPCQ